MAKRFDNELDELKRQVSLMGKSAQKMLLDAIAAMKNQDTKLASQVIQEKAGIFGMEDKIEERALGLIAMFQPVAGDMRALTAAIKMASRFLGRCADYACKLAEAAIYMQSGERVEINCSESSVKACFVRADAFVQNGHSVAGVSHATPLSPPGVNPE